jgi:tripartite-type tricarboxylate transporter receptor subunit TctC
MLSAVTREAGIRRPDIRYGVAAAVVLSLLLPLPVLAQGYPAKPVRIIVAQAPGSVSDTLIRVLAQKMTEKLGQQFIVDNRPGAGGNIGAEVAAKAPADGYSLFMVSAPHAIAPSLYKHLSYDFANDFAPVTLLGSEPLGMVVHPSLPARSIRELVKFLKSRPGQVTYGSTGNGAVNHLAAALFEMRAGVQMVHVPYKGAVYAIPDIMQGTISVLFANVSALKAHVKSGRLRALGVTSSRRSSVLPEVPTIAESGYSGYEAVNWFGIVVPARTPDGIVQKLNAALRQVVALPDVQHYYEGRGSDPKTDTSEEMRTFLQLETEKWAKVVKASGAQID